MCPHFGQGLWLMDGRELRLWVNARLSELDSTRWGHIDPFCECSGLECMARLPLSPQAYKEHKFALPSENRFVVLPGHERDGDRVLERHGTDLVVESQNPAKATAEIAVYPLGHQPARGRVVPRGSLTPRPRTPKPPAARLGLRARDMRKFIIIAAPLLAAAVTLQRRHVPFSFDPPSGKFVWERSHVGLGARDVLP